MLRGTVASVRTLLVALAIFGAAACGSPTPPPASPVCPEPAMTTVAPHPPAPQPPAAAVDPAIMRTEPHRDAPAELGQYGRLVGVWRCQMSRPQPDGTWRPASEATWTFFYALGGKAIQDVWVPDGGGSVGTNLRLYDPATKSWTMVWASAGQTFFDEFTAQADGDAIVMHGDRRAREAFGAHRARITFHDITTDRFAWSYEATAAGADGPWKPIQRLQCRRIGGDTDPR